jgi:hypothetical protein
MVEINRRNRDDFVYNLRIPPKDNIDDQKVGYHLGIKDQHESCGMIYKRAELVFNNDINKKNLISNNASHDNNLYNTMQFLYDTCIMYRADKNTFDKFSDKNIKADAWSRDLTSELMNEKGVEEVTHSKKFEELKHMEQEYSKPFHQIIQEHIPKQDLVDGHIFYDN